MILGLLGKLFCVKRDSFMPNVDVEPTFRQLEIMNDSQTSEQFERDDKARMFTNYAQITSVAEWRQIAAVLDRAFFVLFMILVIVVSFMLGH